MVYQPRENLPMSLRDCSREELVAEMPFVWRPSISLEIFDTVIHEDLADGQPEDDFFDFHRSGKFVMPSRVSEKLNQILTCAPGVIRTAIDWDHDSNEVVRDFEKDCLGLDPDARSTADRPYESAAGFTAPGHYPLKTFARALRADEDRLQDFFADDEQAGGTIAKLGRYLVVAAKPARGRKGMLSVGDISRLTEDGESLVTTSLITIDALTPQE